MIRSGANPFVYGGPVDVPRFIGREYEVNLLFEQVTSSVRGSVAIIGERRYLGQVNATWILRSVSQTASVFSFGETMAKRQLRFPRRRSGPRSPGEA